MTKARQSQLSGTARTGTDILDICEYFGFAAARPPLACDRAGEWGRSYTANTSHLDGKDVILAFNDVLQGPHTAEGGGGGGGVYLLPAWK